MSKRISYVPNRIIDSNGISDGASIYVYQTGTTTPISLYLDSDLTIPTTNPYVVAAGAAVPELFHGSTSDIRVKIITFAGVTVSDDDPYVPFVSSAEFDLISPGMATTLEAHFQVGDADYTNALSRALAALYAAGGGELVIGVGTYNISEALALSNNSTGARVFGTQPSILIRGKGAGGNGQGKTDLGASTLHWTADTGTAEAKLTTLGLGTLTFQDVQFSAAIGANKAFIKTTFTTLFVRRCGFVAGETGRSCLTDAIILGGTVDHETDTTYDLRLSDAGFQGYGTVIADNFFSGIRHAAVLQRFSNSIRIENNNIWNTCGCAAGATSAAFYVNGQSASNSSTGSSISHNLIEITNYDYGLIVENCSNLDLNANDMWDAQAGCLGGVWMKTTASGCRVVEGASGGLYGISGIYTKDDGSGAPNTIIRTENEKTSQVVALITRSSSSNPNVFGATTFSDGTHTLFKPGTSGIGYSINALCDDGATPAFRVETNGADATATATARFYSANSQFAMLTQGGLYLASGNVLYINNQQIVGARQTGVPAAAVDATTTQDLVNWIRQALLNHGLIGT